ncbi:MAG: dihydropteroate synthase [Alphaproteobacteria bacterium]|nr:MAG: dihydropteroate synthase [Alphaproteobacteria bacterium]
MAFDWPGLDPGAVLYLEPTGFCAPTLGAAGQAARLAGTTIYFCAVKLIAAREGRRLAESLLPIDAFMSLCAALPDPHRARAALLWERLTTPRPAIGLGAHGGLALQSPHIMGVLNVTPDSFSDGGDALDPTLAVAHGRQLRSEGADIIDIGGESTRPGAEPVWEGDEIARVEPVLRQLAGQMPLSIDTRKAAVMRVALAHGAVMINDISALAFDPEAMAVAAAAAGPVVLMHAPDDPKTMQQDPQYDDVLLDVFDYLEARVAAAEAAGIARHRLIVDPGIGFAKRLRHNLSILNGLAIFHGLGCVLMLGVSRKRFIGALSREEAPKARLPGSLAAALHGLSRGVHILRVHDVAATKQAVAVWRGLADAATLPPS